MSVDQCSLQMFQSHGGWKRILQQRLNPILINCLIISHYQVLELELVQGQTKQDANFTYSKSSGEI